jgi:hypothetical protein
MIEMIEFSAVVASAIFGVLLAARKELDAVGIITVALAVAFGGGTLRDLFLDRTPLFWIANRHYTVIVFSHRAGRFAVPAGADIAGEFRLSCQKRHLFTCRFLRRAHLARLPHDSHSEDAAGPVAGMSLEADRHALLAPGSWLPATA